MSFKIKSQPDSNLPYWKLNPTKPSEWKKYHQKRKEEVRKRKEDRLIKQIIQKRQEEKESLTKDQTNSETSNNPGKIKNPTVSIALPGSILDNAQSPDLRTYLAGQIARAASVFRVQEIVVFDEEGTAKTTEGEYKGVGKKGNATVQLARILQYLECPQYLRKSFFPKHHDLQYAGVLNPLDSPHHMKSDDITPYREGVVLNRPVKDGRGSFVDVGLQTNVQIDKNLQPGLRVTVKMSESTNTGKRKTGTVVSPSAPYNDCGIYWGYQVRLASTFGAIFTESPYDGGYDYKVGTSEKGSLITEFEPTEFRHLLVVFGGLKGLEYSLDADPDLKIEEPSLLFDAYLNTCPDQGSHTIRTEEAILISLSALQMKYPNIAALKQRS